MMMTLLKDLKKKNSKFVSGAMPEIHFNFLAKLI